MKNKSYIIKAALFATGLSGIVAEYVLATLASYFLGDSVVQWALIISLMLFFMGIGARITKYIHKNVFEFFVFTEFALSIIVSFSALAAYSVIAHSAYTGIIIYILAIITGTLIGMEIPLAIRLNERYEELKFNISGVLEKDYYGSLFGGLLFVFVGLPYLGLTYTPFVLGLINLVVAIVMLNVYPGITTLKKRITLNSTAIALIIVIIIGFTNAEKVVFYGEQKKYQDKVIFSEQSKYQKIVITEWKNDYWLYLNGNLQFASFDEPLYHEVIVHPAMSLFEHPQNILVLGGGDGCAAREILKYPHIKDITIVDIDPAMTDLATTHPILTDINKKSFQNEKVKILNTDAFKYLEKSKDYFDVIIIDLPDPRSIQIARMYSKEFYTLCYKQLRPNGIIITQAGSPYFATESFRCISNTIEAAGFSSIPLHNQVVTMGEWGWILGVKADVTDDQIKNKLKKFDYSTIETRWINNEAIHGITSFGKDYFKKDTKDVGVNKIHDPVLYNYYLNGSWDLY